MFLSKNERIKYSLPFLTSIFTCGNFISTVLRMVGGLLTTRLIDPLWLGTFTGMTLVLGYAPFLQLGILNGLNRELPYLIGKGQTQEAKDLTATAQAWAILLAGLVSLCFMGISFWFFINSNYPFSLGWLAISISAIELFYGTSYLEVTFRTRGDFARLALKNVILNIIGLCLIPLVYFWGFAGFCLRQIIISLCNLGILWTWCPVKLSPRFQKTHFLRLLKIGAPIFIVGQIYSWWSVLDSSLILKFFGAKDLGLYQLATIISTGLILLPNSISQIIYPRLAEEYGRSENLSSLFKILRRPLLFLAASIGLFIIIGWLLLSPVTRILLPNYVEGIPAARWMIVAVSVMMVSPFTTIFNVIKRQGFYALTVVSGIVAYLISIWLLGKDNLVIIIFPQALFIGRIVYLFLGAIFLIYLYKRHKS